MVRILLKIDPLILMEEVEAVAEKRRYRRVDVHFELSCRPAGESGNGSCQGRAVNASPGGLYFKTHDCHCPCGRIVEVELAIPPGNGRLHRPGRISAFAKLLRTERIDAAPAQQDLSDTYYGVAVQFCRAPKLAT